MLACGCAPKNAEPDTARTDTISITPSLTQASAHTPTTTSALDEIVASVGSTTITRAELTKPLYDAYGFSVLMLVVQRDMARDACVQKGISVTESDIANETQWTLDQMFPNAEADEDKQKLLDQFLAQPKPRDQMATRAEFEIVIDTNAHLRKLAEPALHDVVTDDILRQQFDEKYGASVQVRHIVVSNPQEAIALKNRLLAGEDFADLARQFSRNADTRRLGGVLPPFTRNSLRFPENFKAVAFTLKDGEISDPVQAEGSYHVLKLERRIAPKAVKFEDVKDGLAVDLHEQVVMQGVKALRNRFAQEALANLKIADPMLSREFNERLKSRDQLIRDRQKIKEEMQKQRPATPDISAPTTAPASAPAPAPATAPAGGATTTPATQSSP